MGPIENALRNIAPGCLGTDGDKALMNWLWNWESRDVPTLGVSVMRCVSHAGRSLGLTPGHSVGEAYDDGLLPELMSEAIEAAEALGL